VVLHLVSFFTFLQEYISESLDIFLLLLPSSSPDTYTKHQPVVATGKEEEKYLNSQEAFTSEREGARAWASATTTTTSGEECQQVFLFLPLKKI
jgi:hypothetical protein